MFPARLQTVSRITLWAGIQPWMRLKGG